MLPLPRLDGGATVCWVVAQDAPPAVRRRCPRCDCVRPFASTEKSRVNGNGRKLDVWLIYACPVCSATWSLDVHRRVSPASLGDRLVRFERNDPELAWEVARSPRLPSGAEFEPAPFTLIADPIDGARTLIVDCPWGPGPRLDRVLAQGFGVSRAQVAKAAAAGRLGVCRKQLRRPWRGEVRVEVARWDRPAC
ncbi:MAG: DUF1062 domain-containing protein [Proteobacteria bacterium]|nr:DUF1062 domain-containing protein [Pseudomonadota bacterium]